MDKPKSQRIVELDALRGLAAISVVLYHFTYVYGLAVGWRIGEPLFSFVRGRLGVSIFFVISGFVILMSLANSKTIGDFAVSRFARLYPAYFFCAVFTLTILWGFGAANPFVEWADIPSNVAMLATLAGRTPIDGTYWTLTRELLFYLTAVVMFSAAGYKRIEIAVLTWLTIIVLGNLFVADTNFYSVSTLRSFVSLLLNFQLGHLFCAGMMLYKIYRRDATALTYLVLLASILAASVSEWPADGLAIRGAVMSAGYVFVVWIVVSARPWPMRNPAIVYLGTISYSLYLIHEAYGFYLIERLQDRGYSANAAVSISIGVVIATAAIIQAVIERPAQSYLTSLYRRAAVKPVAIAG